MTNPNICRIEIRHDGNSISITHHDPWGTLNQALGAALHPQTGDVHVRGLIGSLTRRLHRTDLIDLARRKMPPDVLIHALDANLTDDCQETWLQDYEPRFMKLLGKLSVLIHEMRVAREAALADLARQVEERESSAVLDATT